MKHFCLSLLLSFSSVQYAKAAQESAVRRSAVEGHVRACFFGHAFDFIEHIDSYHGFIQAQEGGHTPATAAQQTVKKQSVRASGSSRSPSAQLVGLSTDVTPGRDTVSIEPDDIDSGDPFTGRHTSPGYENVAEEAAARENQDCFATKSVSEVSSRLKYSFVLKNVNFDRLFFVKEKLLIIKKIHQKVMLLSGCDITNPEAYLYKKPLHHTLESKNCTEFVGMELMGLMMLCEEAMNDINRSKHMWDEKAGCWCWFPWTYLHHDTKLTMKEALDLETFLADKGEEWFESRLSLSSRI